MHRLTELYQKVAGLRTKPQPLERWLWTFSALSLAILSLWFFVEYEATLNATASIGKVSGYVTVSAISIHTALLVGTLALWLPHRAFKWLAIVLLPLFCWLHTFLSLAPHRTLQTVHTFVDLVPLARQLAGAYGVLQLWLFILLLRDLLPAGRRVGQPR